MAGKMRRRRSVAVLALSTAFVGAVAASFVVRHGTSRIWQQWVTQNAVPDPSYETDLRLQTERTRIEVYDTRRSPTLIRSINVSGLRFVTLKFIDHPGKPTDIFDLRSGSASEAGKTLLHLPVNSASETLVDARWQNLYELESGSPLNMIFGSIVRCQRGGFFYQSNEESPLWTPGGLGSESAVPASVPSATLHIVVRPDMTSPLWDWERRVAMRGSNSRYYLSAYHTSGVPAKELAAAIVRNPPRD